MIDGSDPVSPAVDRRYGSQEAYFPSVRLGEKEEQHSITGRRDLQNPSWQKGEVEQLHNPVQLYTSPLDTLQTLSLWHVFHSKRFQPVHNVYQK